MDYRLIVTEHAENDISDAINWYQNKQEKLGELFAISIDKALGLLLKNPFAFIKVYRDIRRLNTKRFPYSLFYTADKENNTIVIIAVVHNSRHENEWKKRI